MFYRETGQFKTTYAADMAIFPIRQDRIGIAIILIIALILPFVVSDFVLKTILLPFLALMVRGPALAVVIWQLPLPSLFKVTVQLPPLPLTLTFTVPRPSAVPPVFNRRLRTVTL